ncbi:hypothetical protein LX87_04703 [Larkinella arboricola]|uniref:MFS transporter n=1 Tax=Larkinella arboricola TaxID=643671 RepID=A0A327WNB7_LARAB|nr:hypothetical protein [Larkinella arboricola]RAJ93191.1 hypothetical protein LX87_04703 [Larkinella arboricola]
MQAVAPLHGPQNELLRVWGSIKCCNRLFTGAISERIGVANAFRLSEGLVMLVGIISFFTPTLMLLGRKEPVVDNE